MTPLTPAMIEALRPGLEEVLRLAEQDRLAASPKPPEPPPPPPPPPFVPTPLGSAPDLTGYKTVLDERFETLDRWATYGASIVPHLEAGKKLADIDANPLTMLGHRAPKNSGPFAFYADDAVSLTPEGVRFTASRLPEPIADRPYKTGRAWLKGDDGRPRGFLFGFMSARIRTNIRNGAHVAFWFLTLTPWAKPKGGEIDVMERLGHAGIRNRADWYHTAVHVEGSSDRDPNRTIMAEIGEDWHDFAVMWTAERIDWFLDGKCVRSIENPGLHEPQYPILQLAVGSDWALQATKGATGHLDPADFPMTMDVARVLIAQRPQDHAS